MIRRVFSGIRRQQGMENQQSTRFQSFLDIGEQSTVQEFDVYDQIIAGRCDFVPVQVGAHGADARVTAGEQTQTDLGDVNGIDAKAFAGQKDGIAAAAGRDVQHFWAGRQVVKLFDNPGRLLRILTAAELLVPFDAILFHFPDKLSVFRCTRQEFYGNGPESCILERLLKNAACFPAGYENCAGIQKCAGCFNQNILADAFIKLQKSL
jgi:hypothetical protein